jgi:hypothetical protein
MHPYLLASANQSQSTQRAFEPPISGGQNTKVFNRGLRADSAVRAVPIGQLLLNI